MRKNILKAAIAMALGAFSGSVLAESTRVTVTIENLAPNKGTNQTPHWVGFHDGNFDLYNDGTRADFLPVRNDPRRSIERLAEDGATGPLSETFAEIAAYGGVDGTIAGPNGPIAPGDIAVMSFDLDSNISGNRYFSYASMVLPSNDFWIANDNPRTHEIFDEQGNFVAQDFIVNNLSVIDAGTEVNDEIPANTAFFGQAAPNTGVDENGVILDFGDPSGLVQFRQPSNGGNILAEDRFSMADFSIANYPLVKISFSAEKTGESNPYPIGNLDEVTVASGSKITIDVLANDTGTGKVLIAPNAYSLKGGNVALVDNKLTYTSKQGFTGNDNIYYLFKDRLGRTTNGQVDITVTSGNSSPYPTSANDKVSVSAGGTTTIDVLANDTGNGLVLTKPNIWSLKGGNVSLVNNKIVYKAKQGFTGNDNIWYIFSDSQGRTNSGQVDITVK